MMLAATTPIVLVVMPSLNVDGRKAYSTRGQLFDGKVEGRRIVKRSTIPFCDAARALLAEGINPDTVLVMRHEGKVHDALRSTVRVAAGLTVKDDSVGKPVFRKWEPYDARSAVPVPSPMRETDPAATLVPGGQDRILESLSGIETPGLAPDTGEAVLSAISAQKPSRNGGLEQVSTNPSPSAAGIPEPTA
jgi:hypothetical protein